MKVSRLLVLALSIVLFIFGFASVTLSALIDNGDGTITDTDTGLMWLQNGDLGGLMNWFDAMSWANNLVYAGYDDWRLPSAYNSDGSGPCFGDNCADSEMGHLYFIEGIKQYTIAPFINLRPVGDYWTSSEPVGYPIPGTIMTFHFGSGTQYNDYTSFELHTWAVRGAPPPGPEAVVPEPISATLFLVGGTLLTGRRYIRRKNKA